MFISKKKMAITLEKMANWNSLQKWRYNEQIFEVKFSKISRLNVTKKSYMAVKTKICKNENEMSGYSRKIFKTVYVMSKYSYVSRAFDIRFDPPPPSSITFDIIFEQNPYRIKFSSLLTFTIMQSTKQEMNL